MDKKTVDIIGMSRRSVHLVPWDDDADKWCINESYKFPTIADNLDKVTAWFQLHKWFVLARKNNMSDPEHLKWLKQEHSFPIYMQKVYKSIPASVKYPLDEILDWSSRPYFTCTFAYMIALAIRQDYKRIRLWGIDMASKTEIMEGQRSCVDWWLGIAEGKGIEVELPPDCQLLKGGRDRLYAYDEVPEVHRHHIEIKWNRYLTMEGQLVDEYNKSELPYDEKVDLLRKIERYRGAMTALQQVMDELDEVNFTFLHEERGE